MKAIVNLKYGSPDVLHLQDIPTPIPKENEVLIKIHAASINSWDLDWLSGKPTIYRLLFGIRKPNINVLGCDVAGVVESVGKKVTKFNPGDEVMGDLSSGHWGGFAEYTCAREDEIIKKPAPVSFEQAAAIPQAAVLAWQGLQDIRKVKISDKVLINGAGGGVGTFALQLAKAAGAEVTCVDRPDKLEKLKNLGADHAIDYTTQNYTKTGEQYDLILDVVANQSARDYKKALVPGGAFSIIGGRIATMLNVLFYGSLITLGSSKKIKILPHKVNKGLDYLMEQVVSGNLKPVIDKTFTLDKVPEAFRYFESGKFVGKIVIVNK